jgi:uncharacterized membrane protein YgcG
MVTALVLLVPAPAFAFAPSLQRLLGVGAPDGSTVCAGLESIPLGDADLCTHGADSAPARAATASSPGAAVARRSATCIGNGSSGQRVEVLYVHGPSSPAASSSRRSQVTRWAEQVEWTVYESARRFGGDRRVRWSTSGCRIRVTSQRVSTRALRDFRTLIDELAAAGYRRSDRTYLAFVDSDRYCGIATAPRDDRASSNRADRTVGYARVDRPCWDAGDRGYHSIAAHELFHTLGAVQASAPNGTSGAHCNDEHDLLCYDDGTSSGTRTVCRDSSRRTSGAGDANDRLLDCRGDDYFNPAPRRGSYLATHWNTADSARLLDPDAPRSGSGSSGGSSGGSGMSGSGGGSPSPTRDPVGYVIDLVFD